VVLARCGTVFPHGHGRRPFEWCWRAVGLFSPCLWWWGGGCAGGGVPLGPVFALSWCGEVSLGSIRNIVATSLTWYLWSETSGRREGAKHTDHRPNALRIESVFT